MWKIKIKILLFVIAKLGMTLKELEKYITEIPGKILRVEIRKFFLSLFYDIQEIYIVPCQLLSL